ncbi:ABC transporter ATP-binding protein [Nitrospirillum viridazoti]|uniref:ABC transporter ATP-binding protein n=1 Tax=Nitrospirillum viridazoti CBAmc TaxID=1441467 RepID=A0A248JNE5_9PROT|nr:ABC transporter ATP-binding protein [Nitrospirillum amazonense]ASG20263.1 ABC transporter ATP-binding protein [Nitrospirillum amazonense CBAmc]TWB27977.1 nucleoside ABC transporter ATP-binding protein [Nitrospirillum amazonense]
MTPAIAPPLLAIALEDVEKRYPNGTLANSGVSFTVAAGEIHALVGENGAGKSTVMKMLYGLERPTAGILRIHGRPVDFRHPGDAIAAGVGLVAQHLNLVPSLTVAENVVLGHEPRRAGGRLDRAAAAARVRALVEQSGLAVDPAATVASLPVGVRQRVEILKVLHRGARTLLLDEPTAVLTPPETATLFATLRQLAAAGRTILVITHKLDEVKALAGGVTVLCQGRVTGSARMAELDEGALSHLMVGGDLPPPPPRRTARTRPAPRVVARGLGYVDDDGAIRLRDVGFDVAPGEILGIAGVEGNGQDVLARLLSGAAIPGAGDARLDGRVFTGLSPRAVRAQGVAVVTEDRLHDGAAPTLSILDNLLATRYAHPPLSQRGLIDRGTARRWAQAVIDGFGVRAAGPHQPMGALSGGNMQKLILAREIADAPAFLVASQPTRGVDIAAASALHSRLAALRDQGAAILLISADLDELLALSDRIAVLYRGRIVARFAAGAVDAQTLGLHMTGLGPSVDGGDHDAVA